MRLATEYQQRNNKKSQPQDQGRKYIVRLGRGTPQEEGRKRGISLSKQSQKLQKKSIGRNQVSQQKMRQQQQSQLRSSNSNHKITSTACYSSRPDRSPSNYATQHLLISRQHNPQPQIVSKEQRRQVPYAKTQQIFFPSRQQGFAPGVPIQIKEVNFHRQVYIPIKKVPQVQIQPRNIQLSKKVADQIKQNNIYYPLNKNTIKINHCQMPQYQNLYYSNSISKNSNLSIRPQQLQQKNNIIKKCDSSAIPKVSIKVESPTYHVIQHKQSQKMIQSKQDPYNLVNSKLTKRIGESPEQIKEQELLKTKKRLGGLTECKELSNSNSNSNSNSMSVEQKRQLIKKQIKSLWDANKVESIFSMKQSQQVKFQESEIMIDYFNPKQNLQRRR